MHGNRVKPNRALWRSALNQNPSIWQVTVWYLTLLACTKPDENVVKLASPCAIFVPVVAIGSRTRQARRVDDEGARGGGLGLQACGPAGFVVEGDCRAASQGFCNSTATNCAEPMTRLCVGSERMRQESE
jgi:hypothetical protein